MKSAEQSQLEQQLAQVKNEVQKLKLLLKDERKQREDLEQTFVRQMNTVVQQIDQLKRDNEQLRQETLSVGNRYLRQIKAIKQKKEGSETASEAEPSAQPDEQVSTTRIRMQPELPQ